MAKRKSKQQSQTKEGEKSSKKVKGVPTPHDHFFRYTFLQRDHAQDFLAGYLPRDLLDHLKLDELTLESASYIDERLAEHLSDILYEVPLKIAKPDTPVASIYMLFEHKSAPEQQILLQLLRYKYERWIADHLDGKQIRPIIPIVFYHGERNWTVPTRFIDCFEGVDKIFYAFIPDFSYILFDTSEHEAEQIRQVISSDSLQASLLLLKYIYDQGLDMKLEEVLDPLVDSELPRERKITHLMAMLKYIAETNNPIDEKRLTEVVESKFANEEGTMSVLALEWREQGIEIGLKRGKKQGIEQGIEQGVEEGRRQKQRETLRLLINHQFSNQVDDDPSTDDEHESTAEMIAEVSKRLDYVETENELDVLTDMILSGADLIRFRDYLPTKPAATEDEV